MTKIRWKVINATIFWLILAITGYSDSRGPGRLTLEADYAAFRYQGDTTSAYVEIHYNLNRSQLKFQPDENGYVALIDFRLTLKDTNGTTLDTASWTAGNRIDKLSSLAQSGFLITDMLADIIPFGHYLVELEASNDGNTGRTAFPMEIPAFAGAGPELSTIEFAYEIKPDTAGRFVKNGIRVMPNPSHEFALESRLGQFYTEAYGLDTTSVADSVFHVAIEVVDVNGSVVKKHPTLTYQKPGESAVISSQFSIDSLQAGIYGLRVTLVDGDSLSTRMSSFTVSIPRAVARTTMLQGIMKEFPEAVNITSEEDSKKFHDEITFIATSDEMRLFESLPLEGRASFQKDFWARRDPDPSTPQNEFQLEHYKRFKYASDNFSRFQGGSAGWRSDRGRVYIIYGEPTEVERFTPSPEARGWERWWYSGLEGGVYFVFVDYETGGDYTLLHSSKSDEIKDYDWENKVKFLWDHR
ncbi:MAG: hypothetical protein A2W25_01580 [candidate division Zixibacteria bacterium RBG_16_53_22]|nr:MAG: hypothetical protein A2W25_01580 [candidate division Zixibacteria bacterium RBG_16_53_22]